MISQKKNCEFCGKEFPKPITCSKKEWAQRKFCSQKCHYETIKGKIPWNRGLKGVQVAWNKGIPKTDAEKKKMSECRKGQVAWNKGLKGCYSKETIEKMSKSHLNKKCPWISEIGKKRFGNKNPNWKGGLSPLYIFLRNNLKYVGWRKSIFKRDNYTCQNCGQIGGDLNAHHIKRFSDIIKENGITTYESASNCPELWDINNGQTLCLDCHNITKKEE